jgi:hypothetical protein
MPVIAVLRAPDPGRAVPHHFAITPAGARRLP